MVSQLDDVARKLPDTSPGSLQVYEAVIDAVLAEAASAGVAGAQRVTDRLLVVARACNVC